MKVNNITNNSFKALLEPHRQEYSGRQEKLANRVREILTTKNPDNSNYNYTDYFEEKFGLDLYIKPIKEDNSINILSYDKINNSFEHLYNYKNILPKESDFLAFSQYLKEDFREFIEKIITYTVIAFAFGLIFILGNKTNSTQNLEKIKKIEFVQNQKQLEKTTTTLIKNI